MTCKPQLIIQLIWQILVYNDVQIIRPFIISIILYSHFLNKSLTYLLINNTILLFINFITYEFLNVSDCKKSAKYYILSLWLIFIFINHITIFNSSSLSSVQLLSINSNILLAPSVSEYITGISLMLFFICHILSWLT